MKKLSIFLAALLTATVMNLQAAKVYLDCESFDADNNWNQAGAKMGAMFTDGTTTQYTDFMSYDNKKKLFYAEIPSGNWTSCVFIRYSNSATQTGWSDFWNRSCEVIYDGSNNLYTIADWDGCTDTRDKGYHSDGEWGNVPAEPDMHDFLYFVSLKADGTGTVQLNKGLSGKSAQPSDITATFEYSKDRINWTEYTWGTDKKTGTAITLAKGDTVFFRAKGVNGKNATMSRYYNTCYAFYQFAFGTNDSIAAGGNIMSLYDATCEQDAMTAYGFYKLFCKAKQLVSAPKLPAKKLAEYCYGAMFQTCTSLVTAPALPVTTLEDGCYDSMFQNCTALTQAPELPATTLKLSCYSQMFSSCTALTQAPELKATTLTKSCYQGMFSSCSSLVNAPVLPATTLAESCYGYMFNKCTALTQAPELPATTLAKSCYQYMFQNCTALTQAPELKATTLAEYCYFTMFKNCSKLEVDTFSLICDGAELVVPDTTAAPKDWNNGMFTGCKGTAVGNIQLGGHYCIREYGKPRPIYGRKVTNGNFGTICLDKQFIAMEGVEGLFVPYEKNDTVLFCEEVALTDVVAGGAYIFKSNADSVTFFMEGEAVSAPVNNDHMIGWLAADFVLTGETDSYMLYNNQIIKPEVGSTILKNCAFIDLENVPNKAAAPARGRKISFGIDGTNTPTGVVDVNANVNANRKMMKDGQLIIIRDGRKFNAQGQEL